MEKIELTGVEAIALLNRMNNAMTRVDSERLTMYVLRDENLDKVAPDEPIILRSGETWVAEWEGVDYLCIDPIEIQAQIYDGVIRKVLEEYPINNSSSWKPISEIEITDEISKLRPKMFHRHRNLIANPSDIVLYGVVDMGYIGIDLNSNTGLYNKRDYILATVKDLQA